jgi:hypothetical protein
MGVQGRMFELYLLIFIYTIDTNGFSFHRQQQICPSFMQLWYAYMASKCMIICNEKCKRGQSFIVLSLQEKAQCVLWISATSIYLCFMWIQKRAKWWKIIVSKALHFSCCLVLCSDICSSIHCHIVFLGKLPCLIVYICYKVPTILLKKKNCSFGMYCQKTTYHSPPDSVEGGKMWTGYSRGVQKHDLPQPFIIRTCSGSQIFIAFYVVLKR